MGDSDRRGVCPVCDRPFRLRKDGTLGRHGEPKTWPPMNCAGWTQPPKVEPEA